MKCCFLLWESSLITLVRMRVVCKEWNKLSSSTTFVEIIYRNVPIVCIPAFFIQLPWNRRDKSIGYKYTLDNIQSWVIDPATGGLLKTPIPSLDNDHKDLRRDYANIICAYKGIYCLCQKGIGSGTVFTICNPSTNTSKCLPYQKNINWWTFGGMAFDPSTRRFTLLLGGKHNAQDREDNDRHIKIDIYDSESNAWTEVERDAALSTGLPSGMGIYSKGRFHWLPDICSDEIIQFNVSERTWTKIPPPQWVYISDLKDLKGSFRFRGMDYSLESWDRQTALKICDRFLFSRFLGFTWWLTGTDGRVILVNREIRCMWKLREETNEWCQLHITLPNPIYGVAVNSSGWTLVARKKKMVIYDGEGRVVRPIKYSEFDPEVPPMPAESYQLFKHMWAFEWNNVWWP